MAERKAVHATEAGQLSYALQQFEAQSSEFCRYVDAS